MQKDAQGEGASPKRDFCPRQQEASKGPSTPVEGNRYGILTYIGEDAIFELDREGRYLFMNDAGAHRLGLDKESVVGRRVEEMFPGEAASLLQPVTSVFSTGQSVSVLRKATIAGKQLSFSAVLAPIKDDKEQVCSVLVIARDVSQIQSLTKKIRRHQRRVNALFANVGEGVGVVDPDENFRFANPAAAAIFGVESGQLINRNLREFVTEEAWRQIISQTSERKTGSRSTYDLEIVRPDGQRRFIRITSTPRQSDAGDYLGAFGVFTDITTQKRAEEALRRTSEELEKEVARRTAELSRVVEELQQQIRERNQAVKAQAISESRFRTIFDSTPDSVFIKDRDSRYLEVNTGMERLFKQPAAELVGKSDCDLFGAEIGKVMRAEDQRALAGEVVELESTKAVNGVRRTFHVIKAPLTDASGTVLGVCGIARDITERKAGEDELLESRERLRSLTAYVEASREEENKRISREIHDELGQSLTVAKYDLAALRRQIPAGHPELFPLLDALCGRLDSIAQDVRRIARNLRPPLLDHVGLDAALECLATEFQERTGIQCEFTSTTSDTAVDESVAISAFRICQEALTNVARHAGAKAAKVVLSGDEAEFSLEITDDGRGINAEDHAKPTLGLLGMEERARRLGGQFQISPAEPAGTRVSVTFQRNPSSQVDGSALPKPAVSDPPESA